MNLDQPTYDFIGLSDIASAIGLVVDARDEVVFGVRPDAPPAGDDVT